MDGRTFAIQTQIQDYCYISLDNVWLTYRLTWGHCGQPVALDVLGPGIVWKTQQAFEFCRAHNHHHSPVDHDAHAQLEKQGKHNATVAQGVVRVAR